MIEPPDENDKRRAAAGYLHFEDEDPHIFDIYFDTFDEAVDFVNEYGWSFVTEDWVPRGLFEAGIECQDCHGAIVGQLLMFRMNLLIE
jgi:hypothetical protein